MAGLASFLMVGLASDTTALIVELYIILHIYTKWPWAKTQQQEREFGGPDFFCVGLRAAIVQAECVDAGLHKGLK